MDGISVTCAWLQTHRLDVDSNSYVKSIKADVLKKPQKNALPETAVMRY